MYREYPDPHQMGGLSGLHHLQLLRPASGHAQLPFPSNEGPLVSPSGPNTGPATGYQGRHPDSRSGRPQNETDSCPNVSGLHQQRQGGYSGGTTFENLEFAFWSPPSDESEMAGLPPPLSEDSIFDAAFWGLGDWTAGHYE